MTVRQALDTYGEAHVCIARRNPNFPDGIQRIRDVAEWMSEDDRHIYFRLREFGHCGLSRNTDSVSLAHVRHARS